ASASTPASAPATAISRAPLRRHARSRRARNCSSSRAEVLTISNVAPALSTGSAYAATAEHDIRPSAKKRVKVGEQRPRVWLPYQGRHRLPRRQRDPPQYLAPPAGQSPQSR